MSTTLFLPLLISFARKYLLNIGSLFRISNTHHQYQLFLHSIFIHAFRQLLKIPNIFKVLAFFVKSAMLTIHLEQYVTQSINIYFFVIMSASKLFRGHIHRSTYMSSHRNFFVITCLHIRANMFVSRDPKISDYNIFMINENIRGSNIIFLLKISVDDILSVDIFKS
jgi:hypothetical protein